jgi:hypothetical protein
MFGLNDTDTQAANGTNGLSQAPNPPMPPSNPFADTPAAAPEPLIHPLPAGDGPPAPAGIQPPAPAPKPDDLLDLKEQALTSLQPLVGHLDQTPEEKFKTTMMLIQATDNADLVKEAYQAANQITDEKARAQALLDVVNEINYFTQHNGEAEDKPQSD